MEATDLERVIENELRAYAYPWTRGNFTDCMKARNDCRTVYLDDEIVGHGILSFGAGEAHLLNVCIRRDRQGHGYGRQLVEHMLERAQLHDAEIVFLEVRPSNLVACRLYESLGFNEIGVRKNYYPAHVGHEDALVMALDLRVYGNGLGAPDGAQV
jgi:ribosomal-protein-alanine N-acetyltransferase